MQDNVADKFAEVLAKHACRSLRREKSALTGADIGSVLSNPMVSLPALGAGLGGIGGYYSGDDEKSKKRNAMWGGLAGLLSGGGAGLMSAAAGGAATPPPGAGGAIGPAATAPGAAGGTGPAATAPGGGGGWRDWVPDLPAWVNNAVGGPTTDPRSTENLNTVTPVAGGGLAAMLSKVLPTDPITRWLGDRGQVARMLGYTAPGTKGGLPTKPFAQLVDALRAGVPVAPAALVMPKGLTPQEELAWRTSYPVQTNQRTLAVEANLRKVVDSGSWGPSLSQLSPNPTLDRLDRAADVTRAIGDMDPGGSGKPLRKSLPVHQTLALTDRVPAARRLRHLGAAGIAAALVHSQNPTLAGNLQNWIHNIRYPR